MANQTKLLPLIQPPAQEIEAIKQEILRLFKRKIYQQLVSLLEADKNILQNRANSRLLSALRSGELGYDNGVFSGKIDAGISKELRAIGATFDRRLSGFRLPAMLVPKEVHEAIQAGNRLIYDQIREMDRKLGDLAMKEGIGESITDSLNIEHLYDRALWKTDQRIRKSVKGLTIAPTLTSEQRARISSEWTTNLKLHISDFTRNEVLSLRQEIAKAAFSGNRRESLLTSIASSYGVTANKAKFLAKQETSLLLTKFQQTRYEEAGVQYYKWVCVSGSKSHPVRPMHKKNDGKIFRWDDPPIVDEQGNRKNPGQDWNCRCKARPVVCYRPSEG